MSRSFFTKHSCSIVFFLFCSIGAGFGQDTEYLKSIDRVIKTVQEGHLRPRPIDDQFSALVYDETIDILDPYALVFNAADLLELDSTKNSIDNDIHSGRTDFLNQLIDRYSTQLNGLEKLMSSFQSQQLNLNEKDSVQFDSEPEHLSQEAKDAKWYRWLKLQVLLDLFDDQDSIIVNTSFSNEEIETAKNSILKQYECHMKFLNSGYDQKVKDTYIRAIANAFDPHTIYFSASDNEQFESLISNASMSFGFEIESNESSEIEIVSILPGSPAWNSNLINEGDVILNIRSGKQSSLDMTCIGVSRVIEYILDPALKEATFRIKKKSGKQLNVELSKELVEIKENAIQSYILEGQHRISYIYLPTFYTTEDNQILLPNGCANDIGKELIRLEGEQTEALILDIRNNGGGSMLEALRLAGMFIDFGPIVISHHRGEEPTTIKDMDRGILYNKPLIILTNEYSASASELFAACMQDYNRGLVVGAQTFGKSTIQDVFPINADKNNLEFLKLTIGEFYRITGDQLQLLGVTPDIQLPSYIDRKNASEKAYPSALVSNKIDKKTYYRPLPEFPTEILKNKSDARVKQDSLFAQITTNSDDLNSTYIPLSLNGFQSYYNEKMSEFEESEDAESPATDFEVSTPSYRSGLTDTSQETDENLHYMKQDIYLQESFRIGIDLINNLKK